MDFDAGRGDASPTAARVIRLDLRGRGASQRDPAYLNYNILREAQDVLELIDHLGLDARRDLRHLARRA